MISNKTVGIYKITSPSGKVYIGQSVNINKRMIYYKSTAAKKQTKLFNSFKKYGFDAHEVTVVHQLPTDVSQEVLNTYEILYWELYKSIDSEMLNIKVPGNRGRIPPELDKVRIQKAAEGVRRPEVRKRISETLKKRIMTEEHRKNLSIANTGKKYSLERCAEMSRVRIGKKASEETKKKMSEKRQGKKLSVESIKKRTETRRRNNALNCNHLDTNIKEANIDK